MDSSKKNPSAKNSSSLPFLALDEVPTPNKDAENIVALQKEGGRVTGYKLSGGKVISKEEGVSLAKKGKIKGVAIATNKGTQYLKSIPDNKEGNNLGNLPSIPNS